MAMIKTLVCEAPGKLIYRETQLPVVSPGMIILKIKQVGICGTDNLPKNRYATGCEMILHRKIKFSKPN